ncbi:putative extracellular lipase [Sclerotinia borealis F-4128]|uniref:Carboxylic ester hydrolase n=1 Tax=Sclerotinia borealis (strain F-4128) TaxID=1432307 RepID=W9C468_SCLBF|nr:putative extracellular lipase [Sclerotinia borealis F-4128]
MKFSLISIFGLISISFALPVDNIERDEPIGERAAAPTVTIASPAATIIGGSGTTVETFAGIPFAKPPVGALRLKPPQPITSALGIVKATTQAASCPQFFFSDTINGAIPTSALGLLLNTPIFQQVLNAGEDCLYLNIQRPAGTTASSKLPVLFWIFGGGFELGGTSMYDGSSWVAESVAEGKPIIFVAVAYRVGGFGFLPGAEILADGSANLGLLDQRLGLEWVADNIAAFGGDPTKVTIWGESAGAISVFDQMVLYGGDNTYKGKSLFRGAIMNSGSLIPADPVDCPKGQIVYDTVVASAGCSAASDTLACLRGVSYQTLLHATNSVPGLLSYSSVALSYLPRPDGTALTKSPDLLLSSGAWAKVPFIIGDQEDEGTIFALFQSNISTTAQLATYLSDFFFHNAPASVITGLLDTYPNNFISGSPFRTLLLNNWYPQFKRLAAILGDLTFTLTRRAFLQTALKVAPTVPSWSYLSSYDYGTPILGTFHGSDILQVFNGIRPDYAARASKAYYLSFVNTLNPNNGTSKAYAEWPQWSRGKQLLNLYADFGGFIGDDFRGASFDYVVKNLGSFYI